MSIKKQASPPRRAVRKTVRNTATHATASSTLTEKRYHELFDALAEGVVMIAADGHVIAANASAKTLLGMTAREIERALRNDAAWRAIREDGTALPPRDFPVRKTLRSGKATKNVMVGIRLPRRKPRWLSVNTQPLFSPRLRKPIAVVASFEDITQQRLVEAEHAQLAAAFNASVATIKANEQLFRLALNGIPDAFMIYDAQLRLKFVNVRAARFFGKPYYELLGRCDDDLLPVEVTSKYLPALMSARSTKSTQSVEATFALRGRQLSLNATYVPMLDDAGAISQILGILHDFTKRRQTEERMAFMAQYDALTGLPNRYLLLDRMAAAMQRAKRNNSLLGVLFLDLDRFKQVNDTHGHAIGDLLLQQVAERLAGVVRATDTIARLGGDEFTVLLEDTTSVEEITAIAEKIKGAFALPFDTAAGEIFATTSVGITIYPHDDHDRDELLKNADIAMYQAKQERNAWQLYRPEMNSNSAGRLSMEVELRHALEREEFELHFQPQLRIADGALIGVEALLRWNNGKMGRVPPGDFIPLAEDSGLIVPIGEWILRNACEHCKIWERAGLPPVPVSVNIAAPQFRRSNLLQLIGTVLSDCQLDPRWLTLEITESSIMKHAEQTIKTLFGLREMGIMLAIDDFGTGYSSLSYLKRFPVDKLKIDQSFVRDITVDPNDAAIVAAIIAMSKQLGLSTMAEGVETAAQLAFLTRLDCDEYQGYLIGKPVPAADVPALFRAHHA